MSSEEAIKLYKKLYSFRYELDTIQQEEMLDAITEPIQVLFCENRCRNGDLTDGGLFTPVHWCDCPLGAEASQARITIV